MVCSRSVGIHLLRGRCAAALLLAALLLNSVHPGLRLVAVAGALLLFRGCPMCWLVGLFETLALSTKPRADKVYPRRVAAVPADHALDEVHALQPVAQPRQAAAIPTAPSPRKVAVQLRKGFE